MTDARVLVIGATGFIGANVVRALLGRGYAVRGLRRESSDLKAIEGVADRVEFAVGDLRDRASLVAAMRGADFVVHAAGHYPGSGLDTPATVRRGVSEMRNVLGAARDASVRRLAYTSSLTTIGRPSREGRMADERDHYLPGSVPNAYFEVKWAMEQECYRAIARGLDVVTLCPTIVLGEWDVKPTSGRLVTMIANRELPIAVDATVNVVHARDVAEGHVAALATGEASDRYVLGGENLTARELFRTIADAAGVPPPTREVPLGPLRAASFATEIASRVSSEVGKRIGPVAPRVARALRRPPALPLEVVDVLRHAQPVDAGKARRELGIEFAPAKAAVGDALAWFRSHGYVRGA